jgi:hypothetical protein
MEKLVRFLKTGQWGNVFVGKLVDSTLLSTGRQIFYGEDKELYILWYDDETVEISIILGEVHGISLRQPSMLLSTGNKKKTLSFGGFLKFLNLNGINWVFEIKPYFNDKVIAIKTEGNVLIIFNFSEKYLFVDSIRVN